MNTVHVQRETSSYIILFFLWDYVHIVTCEKCLVRIEERVLLQVVLNRFGKLRSGLYAGISITEIWSKYPRWGRGSTLYACFTVV